LRNAQKKNKERGILEKWNIGMMVFSETNN
jgi:hypothetical protein